MSQAKGFINRFLPVTKILSVWGVFFCVFLGVMIPVFALAQSACGSCSTKSHPEIFCVSGLDNKSVADYNNGIGRIDLKLEPTFTNYVSNQYPILMEGLRCNVMDLNNCQLEATKQSCKNIISLGEVPAFLQKASALNEDDSSYQPFVGVKPALGVKIGDLEFGDVRRQGAFVVVPFLAQYISAVYRYLVGIIAIIAIIMVMYGGFRYMIGSAAGDVKVGKQIIIDAIVGMMLLFGAVSLLRVINPATLDLTKIRIRIMPLEAEETMGVEELEVGEPTSEPFEDKDACRVLADYIPGFIEIANKQNDVVLGLASSEGKIPRVSCSWCYNDPEDGAACAGDPPDRLISINPALCRMLVDLAEQMRAEQRKEQEDKANGSGASQGTDQAKKEEFVVYGIKKITVSSIIGGHSRCAGGRNSTACKECISSIGKKGQSRHWTGNGIDLAPDAGIQKYLVDGWPKKLGKPSPIRQIIGPFGLVGDLNCSKLNRSGKASSPYLCNQGSCGASFDASVLCGHMNHIHVGF